MKYFKLLAIFAFTSIISFSSCKEETKTTKQESNQSAPSEVKAPTATPVTTPATTGQNAAGVYHYTCSKGCEGGSGSTGNCSNCGGLLAHNAAYHANTNTTPTNTQTNSPLVTPTPTPAAAQNAAGVWHYTCGNGCAGGAGTAGACGSCGGTLAHNTAYHQ